MAFIGNILGAGTLSGGITQDTYVGRLLEMPAGGGTITKIYAKLQSSSGIIDLAAAIFSVNGSNESDALLAEDEVNAVVDTVNDWYSVTLGTPLYLAGGTKFFAKAWPHGAYFINYETGGSATEFFQRWGEDWNKVPPPRWQDPDSNSGYYYTGSEIAFIYVEYTPAGGVSNNKFNGAGLGSTYLGAPILEYSTSSDIEFVATAQSLHLNTIAPNAYGEVNYLSSAKSLHLNVITPIAYGDSNFSAGSIALHLNAITPNAYGEVNYTASALSLHLNVITPSVYGDSNFIASAKALHFNTITPTVTIETNFNASVYTLHLNAIAPNAYGELNYLSSAKALHLNIITPNAIGNSNFSASANALHYNIITPIAYGESNFSAGSTALHLNAISPYAYGELNYLSSAKALHLNIITPNVIGDSNFSAIVKALHYNIIIPEVDEGLTIYTRVLKYWNGSQFIKAKLRVYKDGNFVDCFLKFYDEGEWKSIDVRG